MAAERKVTTVADKYQVTNQQRRVQVLDNGRTVDGVQITFVTKPSNVESELFVPQTQYTPDEVRQLLDAAAQNVEAIHTL